MRENFLHYIWKHKKFDIRNLKTSNSESITLVSVGQHNHDSGPDFFNAKLSIDEQLWAGNVEIHVKSSDWYLHHHESDTAYDNVILHVVYEHNTDIFRRDNSIIPTLIIKDYICLSLINNYYHLFSKQYKWINCDSDFANVDELIMNHWMERLYFERLEQKSDSIGDLLRNSNNDWEATLFNLIAKNFGLKVNGDAFLSISKSIDYSIVRKIQSNQIQLEALFFGQAGLLESDLQDDHYIRLVKIYTYLKQKFQLTKNHVIPLQLFRLRPANFPTIRFSQLAGLYFKEPNLFSKVVETDAMDKFYELFKVGATLYWKTHYTFGNTSRTSRKMLTKSFIDLLVVNSIMPLKFYYAKQHGLDVNDSLLGMIRSIASEKNAIVSAFNNLKYKSNSALESQALIQLKSEYCNKNRCLHCAIGNALITK